MKENPNRFRQISVQTDSKGSVTCFGLTNDGRLFMLQGHPSQTKGDSAKTWLRVADAPGEKGSDA